MIVRIVLLCGLFAIAGVAPTGFFIICALLYALRYTAYELIVVSVCIDGLYGTGGFFLVPYYTIITCVALLFIEWFKPLISVYNEDK